MPQFQILVENFGGDLEPLARSLCDLARHLKMAVSSVVGKDDKGKDVLMRALPTSAPQEVLTEVQGRSVTRVYTVPEPRDDGR